MSDSLITALQDCAGKRKVETKHLSMGEYIEEVKARPGVAAGAHRRVYDMIRSYGIKVDPESGDETYLFFERELFGIENSLREVMEYFKGSAMGSDVAKRFLLVYGPPSSGKSNLVSMIKDAMEAWSHTDEGAVYAIHGCPMNEEPLHAIPKTMRSQVEKELGVSIEGELCPLCAMRLRDDFKGDFMKFQIKRVYFSQQSRLGLGTFVPSDPKSQDVSELIGSVDLSKIGEFGTESDPRAYKFDGELNVSNRGIMEFIEILKVDQKFLYVLLTATQEKVIKTPRFPLISCDEVILSHTNESEYKEFVGNPKNEALIDRMIVCRIPYNLRVRDEVRIYEKLLKTKGLAEVHVAPHTLRVAAMFSVLSRIEDPKDQNLDKVKKMKLYDGEEVEGFSLKDVPRLMKESFSEGMDGVSPRYIINRLVTTAIRGLEEEECETTKEKAADFVETKRRVNFITPIHVLRSLKEGLTTSSKFKPEERTRFEDLISMVRKEFDQIAKNEVQKAFFVSFEDEAKVLLDNYIDNVEAYMEKTKLQDPITKEEIEPSEQLMRAIESKIGISEGAKDSFRNEILRKVAASTRRGDKFRYESHGRLREAIEKQLFEDRKDLIKMTITSRTKRDPDELKRINQVVQTLCDKHGYIPESANELLKYVSSIMMREK